MSYNTKHEKPFYLEVIKWQKAKKGMWISVNCLFSFLQ